MGNNLIKEKLADLVNAIANMMLDLRVPVEQAKEDAPRILNALVNDDLWKQVGPVLWPAYEAEFKKRYRIINRGGINKGWIARHWNRSRK